MYKNVVFDVGNVLVHFRYKEYMRDLGFSEDVVELFSDKVVNSAHWSRLDEGVADEDEAEEFFRGEVPGYEKELAEFWKHLEDIAREYDYSEKLMIDLKAKGYKVYLLSNYPDKLSDMHWSKFKFLKQMDGYIISSKVKLIKPTPEIYKLLESKFGIKLSESIFVDDRQINVDAAEKLGMKGILFTGIDDLTKKLIFC